MAEEREREKERPGVDEFIEGLVLAMYLWVILVAMLSPESHQQVVDWEALPLRCLKRGPFGCSNISGVEPQSSGWILTCPLQQEHGFVHTHDHGRVILF